MRKKEFAPSLYPSYFLFFFDILSKRMLKRVALSTLLLIFFIIAGVVYFKPEVIETSSYLISPLPKIFTRKSPQVLATTNFWKPNISTESITLMPLNLSAHAAISYDLTSDKLLLADNIHKRMPLASLTKIMTAIVTIENENLDQEVEISDNAASVGENVMGASEGESYTRKDLLYGLILPSGNDAAEALADTSSVGRENFVYLMNKKAEDLGLNDTHFTNPSGLEGDGDQYSTVYDLLILTKYGLELPEFAKVVSALEYDIPATSENKHIYLSNETNLLTSYPGVKGVKTGYTYEAGLCLVTYLDYGGHKIIAVILNSENRRQEMKEILDYSMRNLGVNPPAHK